MVLTLLSWMMSGNSTTLTLSQQFAQIRLAILVNPQLANCVTDLISLWGCVCLRLKLLDRCDSGTRPKLSTQYVEETSDALGKVEPNEFTILTGDFKAHVGNDAVVWKGVNGQHGDADINDNGRLLLQLCCTTHCASQHFPPSQIFVQLNLIHRFVKSTVTNWFLHNFSQLTCSVQCWTCVSELVTNCRPITTWLSTT